MTGRFKGFVSRLKQDFPRVGSTHCFIHLESLMAKTIPTELKSVLDSVVKMVNFVKSSPLRTRKDPPPTSLWRKKKNSQNFSQTTHFN
jgi:hypothetical protein